MKPCLRSSSESFSMLIPGWTVTVRSAMSISRIRFISFTSTMIPWRSGTAPSVRPVPPARGTTGRRSRLASFTTSETCSAEVGSTTTSESATVAISDPRRLRHELHQVDDLDALLFALLCQRPLGPHAGGYERVNLERLGALHAAPADLGGEVGTLDRQPGARAGAVRPLRDVVDVLEGESGDRAQDLARFLVNALALVEAAGVVIGGGPLDRLRELQPAVADEFRDELDDEDDLEVVVVAKEARIVLGEGDVVVGVEDEDP